MKHACCVLLLATLLTTGTITAVQAQTFPPERETISLETKAGTVGIDLAGGSIIDFRMAGSDLNPLTWNYPREGDTRPRDMAQHVCFDRWGPPSKQERENGMPFHGEATKVVWTVLQQPETRTGGVTAVVKCDLPMGGMSLTRSIELSDRSAVFIVTDEITNTNALGRVWNIVQHGTIAPPFLDETVIVDSNADKGFVQADAMPDPEARVIYWPTFAYKDKLVDMRRLTDNAVPDVISFALPDSVEDGWITAANPGKGLLIGYLWDKEEYPWASFWRNLSRNGKPAARGLEFGTTSLHQPYPVIMDIMTIFDTPIFSYLDSKETIEKSYVTFLAEIPTDFGGVENVIWHNGRIELIERAEKPRRIVISY